MSEKKESNKVLDLITNLQNDKQRLKKKEITQEQVKEYNETIFENYPTLARKIMEDQLDMDVMGPMLQSLDKMQQGKQSQHEASVEVGTFLRDKFVIPDLKKKGLNVNLNSDLNNLNEEEAKKKVNSMLNI